MDPQKPAVQEQTKTEKRHYQKPALVVHGTLGELTQTGGTTGHPDGIFSKKLS